MARYLLKDPCATDSFESKISMKNRNMDRASIYFMEKDDQNTYDFDETLPPLPLPDLRDTMERFYDSVKPFGTEAELSKTRAVIAAFEKGIGAELQAKLRERAGKMKNWLDAWWDKYGYHSLRFPLNPYMVMAMPVNLQDFNIPETPEMMLKNLARMTYYTIEFWDLLRKAKIKPLTSNGGKIKYSSAHYKRFFSTNRVPGVEYDHIEKHFKVVNEGPTPTHCLISGKGRIFKFECTHPDGTLITEQELLILLQRVRSILDNASLGDCVPVLTHDDRTTWANNRQYLMEVSPHNKEVVKLVESSAVVLVFDENEPKNYAECSEYSIYGDFHSKWGDRSSTFIAYKNGKFACVGEHSAYDGTISVSYALFVLLGMHENPEPDWENFDRSKTPEFEELKFDLDGPLRLEVQRMMKFVVDRGHDVIVTHVGFGDYGKEFMKMCKLHPDSFVQVVLQLAYAEMHDKIAPTYETALMRHYYYGRTETLRSCTNEVHRFIQIARHAKSSQTEIVKAFRAAVEHHNHMMGEARKGHGVDRHLFGLWCTAYENQIEIPALYSDPLYLRSGGGGNFVLSTSTLGYTSIVGFVAPMLADGYGVFYSITPDSLQIQTTAFRDSSVTDAHKFNEVFMHSFRRLKSLLEDVENSKL